VGVRLFKTKGFAIIEVDKEAGFIYQKNNRRNRMETYIFYGLALIGLIVSFQKDKEKTRLALKKSWKSLENILPQLLTMILFISVLLTYLNTGLISRLIGGESGWGGVMLAAVVGSITMIPPFVAFPTASMLLKSGAGYMQIGAFVSTLTMVGIVTMPVEMKYFSKKMTLYRNILAFLFSLGVAFLIKEVTG
jgi:uncharacterized membrane protein YraQ (UPF0718 family)